MHTRSSSNLVGNSSSNPTTSNPKRRNRRRSNQERFCSLLKLSPVVTMADQRTMAELLRAPTEGYAEAIVVPPILAEHFELKHSLINMMTSDQFFGLEKDNPHDHIRWFNKITSTIKYKDVPNSAIKLMLFPFSLAGAARRWLEKEPPRSILTWEDLITGIIFKDMLQQPTGNYNQGNFGYRPPGVANQTRPLSFVQQNRQNNQNRFSQPQGYNRGNNFNQNLTYQALIQQNKSVPLSELEKIKKMNDVNIKAMQAQINNVKNELRNEMESSIQASMSNQTNELKNLMASFFQMNTASTSGIGSLPSNTVANPKGELKAITTRSGLVLDGATVPMPPLFINPEEDEHVKETLTYPKHDLFATNHPSGNPTSSLTSHTDLTSPEVINPSSGNPTPISEPVTKSSSSSPTLTSIEESDLIWEEFKAYLASDSFPPGNSNPSSPLPPFHNSLSGSTTSSSPSLPISETSDYFLEEFADELAHITFPPGNDDLPFDAESDLREIEYLLNHDPIKEMDSILEDSVDENSLDDNLDTVNDDTHDDPFDFKEEKIKESKILIDELDLPKSNNTNNEDKIFNPGILIHGNLFEVTNFATPNKNVKKATNASLILEDFNPPLSLYELPFHKEVPGLGALLSFSPKNEEKVNNPGILTSKRVHTSLLPELSHQSTKAFKVTKNLESPMEIFPCSYQEDIRVLDVSCFHFYPP
ncbi:hypothetical protein Tco_0942361 [Tanacetum coccineum]